MAFVAALNDHLNTLQPALPLIVPSDPNFEATRACFAKREGRTPAAIARPQNAAHVQALIKYCVANGVDFVVRSGGHDTSGRSQVGGALSIDLRDINYVRIAEDQTTVALGGGALFKDIAKGLDGKGVVCAFGTVATVGFVGWAGLGGYGPFMARYGLGADQIVAAKVVNAAGDLIEAGPDLLQGIRGAAGIFGVIVETTIKLYPHQGTPLLTSLVVYDPSDLKASWTSFVTGYDKLTKAAPLPSALQVQPYAAMLPGLGRALAIAVSWSSEDHDEGKKWIDKIAKLGKCVMNKTEPKTMAEYAASNEKLATYGSYGRTYTINLKKYTVKTAEILAKYTTLNPGGGTAILMPSYRASAPSLPSVFPERRDHVVCEFLSTTPVAEIEKKADEWARNGIKELMESDPENVLGTAYVSLLGDEDSDYAKLYGEKYEMLVALKKKYDPDNVFKYAVPKLKI